METVTLLETRITITGIKGSQVRFSKLRLNGFKSFVDPTDLIIADGLTGVVGPNGCGKSNLLEALRWVMGENRPTAMRGGGMEDVIFAGAATRPARNFAEVSLHIDNSERLAPAGFNDSDLLEVTRRITRDVGSAYKANTKDMRARDVQMLFADASTGAHSPALVRQGQIAQLISAKPKARRRILEEAAGISGLYARRHEAELKLKGAEGNLARVDDVLEQLGNQLAQLTRQARQAERYKELGANLRLAEGLLLFRRWKEADEAHLSAKEMLKNAILEAATAEAAARKASAARQTSEEALPPLREEEAIANAILQRLNVQKDILTSQEKQAIEAIENLQNQIEQLSRDISREHDLNRDAGESVAQLRSEADGLQRDNKDHPTKLAKAEADAKESAAVLLTRETELSELTEEVARLAARHQSVQRSLDDAGLRLQKASAAQTEAQDDLTTAKAQVSDLQAQDMAAKQAQDGATKAVQKAEADLQQAEEARSHCQNDESQSRSEKSEIGGIVTALRAEVEALTRLLERDQSQGAQALDDISVDAGYEKALGAALADDLRAPLVSDDGITGWASLPDYTANAPLPQGAEKFTDHAVMPAALHRRMTHIGIVAAAEGAKLQSQLHAGQRLVSLEGDLWRWDGYRATAKDAPSATALRLEQRNRLKALRAELAAAEAKAEKAEQAHATLAAKLSNLTAANEQARTARSMAEKALTTARSSASQAESDLNRAQGRVETMALAVQRHVEDAVAAQIRLSEAEHNFAQLEDISGARTRVEDVKLTVEASRVTMMSRKSSLDEVRRMGEARSARLNIIAKDIASWEKRQSNAASRNSELESRKTNAEAELKTAKDMPAAITAQRDELAGELEKAEERRKSAADKVAEGDTTLRRAVEAEREAERSAADLRETRARQEARVEGASESLQAASLRIEEDLETTPQNLLDQLDVDPAQMPPSEDVEAEVARLRRSREALGAVNLRAVGDAEEVRSEKEKLDSEKTDLIEAIKALRSGIANLNKEGRKRLLEAFDEVNQSFGTLFTHLFGGGEAKLELVESDDPLDAGLEIMCQPPGKKLSTLSLLSGGEQTLTAMALIFAVFLANPAPICVLDEVDAPLDDANVNRFCDLLDEMTRRTKTRFLIITHHAVTMGRMNRLFGVTMAEQGVSQLVSVDLKDAEQLVA